MKEYFMIIGRMPRFCSHGLGFLPACFSALVALTVIVTYIMAVCFGHVYVFFPTISATGEAEPERNIFSLMMSLASFIGFLTVAVRYVQYNFITEYIEQDQRKVIIVNKVSLFIGTVVCIGGAIVASFQANGTSASGHLVGAICTFAGGILYMWMNTYLSWKMVRCGVNTRKLCTIRIMLSFFAFVAFTICVATRYIAFRQYKYGNKSTKGTEHWQPGDSGYRMHLASSITEWITAICILLFFVTFCGEFEKITFDFRVKKRNITALPFEVSGDDRTTPLLT